MNDPAGEETNTPIIQPSPSGQSNQKICASCPNAHQCREVWSSPRRGPFSPTGLSLSSAVVFLLPIVSAISAGALAENFMADVDGFSHGLAVAMVTGLLLGIFAAWLILPAIKKRFPVQT